MEDDFYQLDGLVEIPHSARFTIERANAIVDATEHHKDYEVIQRLISADAANTSFACIVVDVECHAVPSRNRHGIQFRERLALYVPDDRKKLVQVSALRHSFPRLLHQNQSLIGSPASLCLYFEPPSVVSSTWTAQSFLRRIQWWLEKSALDELHPADQPVEQLFFASKYELVLPWDYESDGSSNSRFSISYNGPRPNGGITFILHSIPQGEPIGKSAVETLEFSLPPVLHGQVESDPNTLGELAAQLTAREVNVIDGIRTSIQAKISNAGLPVEPNPPWVIILLHIPIRREENGGTERISRRAFLLNVGVMELGVAIDAVCIHEKKYFNLNLLSDQEKNAATQWQSLELFAVEILYKNSSEASRRQSGITDAGPDATMIGAGALGSALLNIWGRGGWGRWRLIDNDHVKPHNLVRHVAYVPHIGTPKVEVVRQLHNEITSGANVITPICVDACDLQNSQISTALAASALVVDASAALEYPRLVSSIEGLARHMSVFLTPSGNAAVLLAEDSARSLRLRTLEAQYYRALIHEKWGSDHLDGHQGATYWSGASCRDISMALPYSRVLGHVGNLAEQVQHASHERQAVIRIWTRDSNSGSVVVHTIDTFPEKGHSLGSLELYMDDGVLKNLRALRKQHSPRETGGVLIGYYDLNVNAVVIVDGLPAPQDSVSTGTSFERGIAGLAETIAEISRRTAGIVRYVGEWHSHPPGHSANPSKDDIMQLTYLTLGMAADGFPAISLIVGEDDIQILQGALKND